MYIECFLIEFALFYLLLSYVLYVYGFFSLSFARYIFNDHLCSGFFSLSVVCLPMLLLLLFLIFFFCSSFSPPRQRPKVLFCRFFVLCEHMMRERNRLNFSCFYVSFGDEHLVLHQLHCVSFAGVPGETKRDGKSLSTSARFDFQNHLNT